jgi:heme-degrading monooxygenase HmoA
LIVRVLQGRVLPENINDFREQASQLIGRESAPEGLVNAHVGRQVHADGSEQIIFVTVWRDLESLYRWVGGRDLLETPVMSDRRNLFKSFDVQHYEVVEFADPAVFGTAPALPEPAAISDSMPAVMGTTI